MTAVAVTRYFSVLFFNFNNGRQILVNWVIKLPAARVPAILKSGYL